MNLWEENWPFPLELSGLVFVTGVRLGGEVVSG